MNDSSHSESASTTGNSNSSSRSGWKVLLPLILLGLPAIILWGASETENTDVVVPLKDSPAEQPVENSVDEKYRQLIVGQWEMERDGRRFLTVHSDGSAQMEVEIAGNWSLLFGSKMKFDIEWTIEDGVLTMITTGGEPKGKVDMITSMYGKKRTQPIKILDATTLRLPDDEPDGADHVWTRVSPVVTR